METDLEGNVCGVQGIKRGSHNSTAGKDCD